MALIVALILWLGAQTYSNSLTLTKIETNLVHLVKGSDKSMAELLRDIRVHEKHLDTIWPRLRELKEKMQAMEIGSGKESNWRH